MQRKWCEAMPKGEIGKKSVAAQGYKLCNRLFRLERNLEELSDADRQAKRQEKAKPIIDEYYAWIARPTGFFIFPVDITCHHCYNKFLENALWQALPMFHAADWSRRKPEIADAFRQTLPLSAAADSGFYPELLTQIDVSSNQGPMLVVSIMNDVIMAARREERPATPLGDLFGLAKV